jgi:hypothetical protein
MKLSLSIVVSLLVMIAVGAVAVWVLGTTTPVAEEKPWNRETISQTQHDAELLTAALRQYKKDRGTWPRFLDDLVPTYAMEIRAPSAGRQNWHYEFSSDEFVLKFGTWVYGSSKTVPDDGYILRASSTSMKWDAW